MASTRRYIFIVAGQRIQLELSISVLRGLCNLDSANDLFAVHEDSTLDPSATFSSAASDHHPVIMGTEDIESDDDADPIPAATDIAVPAPFRE
jgi:hypothetical protein